MYLPHLPKVAASYRRYTLGIVVVLLAVFGLGLRPVHAQTTLSSDVVSGSALVYSDAVTLAADVTITAPSVTFESTVDGDGNGPWDLTLNISGETRFEGKVGDTEPLGNLTTDAAGSTTLAIPGGSASVITMETTGTQRYGNAVTLTERQVLLAGTSLIFDATIDGTRDLSTLAPTRIEFNASVGATTRLGALTVFGPLYVQAAEVITGNVQRYNAPVEINPVGGTTTFNSTGNGVIFVTSLRSATTGEDAAVVTARGATFADVGDNGQRLAGLSVTTTLNPATVNGSVAVDGVSTFVNGLTLASGADLSMEIGGTTAGTGYDQVQVTGSVDVTNADLVVSLDNHVPNGTYTLVDNDGTDAITGTFAGLPEGSTFTVDGTDFFITYTGGDGNDIVLSPSLLLSSDVISATPLVYSDAVILTADVTITAPSVTFESTVDGDGNGPWDLTLNISGETRFEGKVGGTTPLGNLTTDAAGTTTLASLGTPTVETTGTQRYGNAITLTERQVLEAGTSLIFDATIDGLKLLIARAPTRIEFNASVGATTQLNSLQTGGGGTLYVQAAEVATAFAQTYTTNVEVNPAGGTTTFRSSSNDVLFNKSLRSATAGEDAVVVTARNATFADVGDNGQRLAGLSVTTTADPVTVSGSVAVDGVSTFVNGLLLASGADLSMEIGGTTAGTGYDQVQVTGSVDVTNADLVVSLDSFVPQSSDMYTLVDNDGTDAIIGTFNGLAEGATLVVGGTHFTITYTGGDGNDIVLSPSLLLSLDMISATPLVYSDAVILTANVTITAPSVTFESTVDGDGNGPWDLTLNISGETRFEGKVGDTEPLGNLTTDAAGTTTLASPGANTPSTAVVETTGTQRYGDAVTLTKRQVLEAGISLIFDATLDGNQVLYARAASRIEFNASVGATTQLSSMETRGTATLYVQAAEIVTASVQRYRTPVEINPAGGTTTFNSTGNGVLFERSLRSATAGEDAALVTARNATFTDVGDNGQRLAGLSVITTTLDPVTVSGSVAVDGFSTFVNGLLLASGADLNMEIGGTTAGTGYDQVQVTGSVDITDADLVVSLDNYVPNGTYTLLDNDGSDAITGTFAGLPEGSTFTVDGVEFTISYVGGSGNDVVLTANTFDLLVDTISDSQAYDPTASLNACANRVPDGDCTLREAIQVANANPGLDAIGFLISETHGATAAGQATLAPSTVLPVLTDAGISILGYTQTAASANTLATGSNAAVKVVLDGSLVSGFPNGLEIASSATGVTISGLSILNFDNAAIRVEGANAVVEGNYLGVRPDGTTAGPNGYGVFAAAAGVRIGTDGDSDGDAGERNVISGNAFVGVSIRGNGVSVVGNYIGLTAAGTAARANAEQGVSLGLDGTNASVTDNVISGNTLAGIRIFANGASVQRNIIGLDATGQSAVPNAGGGIEVGNTGGGISATDVTISDNTISGNSGDGVNVGAASTATVLSNRIGFDTDSADQIGNTGAGVEVTGTAEVSIRENRMGGNGGLGIDLVGGTEDSAGVTANDNDDPDSGPNTLQNYPVITAITDNGSGGYDIAFSLDAPANTNFYVEAFASSSADASGFGEGERFIGSVAGVTTLGTPDLTSTLSVTDLAPGEFVTMTAARYTINLGAPNTFGPTSEFSAAFILPDLAVNSTADHADANTGDGICDTGQTNTEGNPTCTLRAAIQEANALAGTNPIRFAIPTTESGCNASTGVCTIAPSSGLPGLSQPVQLDGSTQAGADCNTKTLKVELDGRNAGTGQVRGLVLGSGASGSLVRGLAIYGFSSQGIQINNNSTGSQVACNIIGTDVAGTSGLGNASGQGTGGIEIFGSGATGNVIGTNSNDASEGNVISGNAKNGIIAQFATGNTIAGNWLGVAPDGATPLGNTLRGVVMTNGASGHQIGGTGANEGNVIAHNGSAGVFISSASGTIKHTISGNRIFSNSGLGIDLADVAGNDPDDADDGANEGQNFPDISSATLESNGDVTVTYSVDATTGNAAYPLRVEFFKADSEGEEGEVYLGAVTYASENAQQPVSVTFTPASTVTNTDLLIATATDANGNTSEFSTSPVVLPVELTDFNALRDGDAVLLRWTTASETNNAGFSVEHFAPEAPNWADVAFVAGYGTTLDAQTYAHRLVTDVPGTHRFRLKQIDFDGTFAYSAEVEVSLEMAETFDLSPVYPNPFNPSSQFELRVREAQQVSVAIYDAVGREVTRLFDGTLETTKAHVFMLDASGWASGLYVIRVVGERFTSSQIVTLVK